MPGAISIQVGASSDGLSSSLILPQPGQFVVACVDYDNLILPGNDATGAVGVASTSAAAIALAMATPFKTQERLGQVMPHLGNDGILYVMVKGRTGGVSYLKMDGVTVQDASWRSQLSGYRRVTIKSTGDFSDTTFDRIQAGFIPPAGINATGYNPTGVPTVNTIPCQLNGGGAANLPLEAAPSNTSTITGYRIRFDPNTTTAALRNACSNIVRNVAGQVNVGANLPAVPVGTDVFFIEKTAYQIGSPTATIGDCGAVFIVGERWAAAGTLSFNMGTTQLSACESLSGFSITVNRGEMVSMFINTQNIDGTFNSLGTAGRHECTTFAFTNLRTVAIAQMAQVGTGGVTTNGVGRYASLGQGSTIAYTFSDVAMANNAGTTLAQSGRTVGNGGSTTMTRTRFCATHAGNTIFASSLTLSIRGVDISNNQGNCILIGQNTGVSSGMILTIDDAVTTDGGNTGNVLNITQCQDSSVRWGGTVANTLTATNDILSTSVNLQFSTLTTTNIIDAVGNNIFGAGSAEVLSQFGIVMANVSGVTIPPFMIVRSNNLGQVAATAQANNAANAAGIAGVTLNTAINGANCLMAPLGSHCAVQFDASLPVPGAIAYLSVGTTGDAQSGIPPLAATNQKNRLGIVERITGGTIGIMTFQPDKLAVLADGAA